MLEWFSLQGKTALVTGGTKGLGFEMAKALALAGADVAVTSRERAQAEAAARKLAEATGRRIVPVVVDVRDPEGVEAMARETLAALDRVDVLVNNAGINIRRPTVEQTLEEFRTILDTNLVGAFLAARVLGRHMIERGSGVIVNMASMLGLVGLPERPGYTASKGALVQLTRTMALEMAPHGVRVNALCPGPFVTEINTPVLENPEAYNYFVQRIPLGRWGRPEEIGPAIVFLASEASSFMTGATLVMDGGWTAQ